MRKKLIAGNWKMNKTPIDAIPLVKDIVAASANVHNVDVVICPPFTALESVARALEGSAVKMGAQNMHPEPSGAYTGEVSAVMLRALFASYVILGHSERRTYFKETDAFINQKVLAALKSQL
jgi:triosephosphate isomerase